MIQWSSSLRKRKQIHLGARLFTRKKTITKFNINNNDSGTSVVYQSEKRYDLSLSVKNKGDLFNPQLGTTILSFEKV
jgi:hypothetical protein